MAEVNQFEKPLASNFTNTYVSQYVPLPFDVLNKRIEDEQKKWDDNKDEAYKFLSTMGDKTLKWDSPVMRNKVKELTTTIDAGLKNNKGDWSSMDQTIRNASQEYRNFITTGHGATATANLKIREGFQKKLSENDKMGDYGMLALSGSDKMYASHAEDGITPAEKGVEYRPLPLYEAVDFRSDLDRLAVSMKETGYSGSKYDIDPTNGELIISKDAHYSALKTAPILRAWETSLRGNEKFISMLDSQYAILQANGEEGFKYKGYDGVVSYEDFVNNEIAKRTQGSKAFEHSDKTTSYNTNTRPGGEDAAKVRQNNQALPIEFATTITRDPRGLKAVNSVPEYREIVRSTTTNLWNDLADKFQTAHPTLRRENFNTFMTNAGKAVYGKDFDFDNGTWQLRMQKDLAFGRKKPEDFNVAGYPLFNPNHASEFSEFRASAEEAFYKSKNMNHMYIDVMDQMIHGAKTTAEAEKLKAQRSALQSHFENVYENETSKSMLPFYIDPKKGESLMHDGHISETLLNAFKTLQGANYEAWYQPRINSAKSGTYNTSTADDVQIIALDAHRNAIKNADGSLKTVRLGGDNSFYRNITDLQKQRLMKVSFSYIDENQEVAKMPLETILKKELAHYMESDEVKTAVGEEKGDKKARIEAAMRKQKESQLLGAIQLVKNTSEDKNYTLALPSGVGVSADYSTELKKGKDSMYAALDEMIAPGTKYQMEVGRLKMMAVTSPADRYEYAPGIYGVKETTTNGTTGKADTEVSITIDPRKLEKWLHQPLGSLQSIDNVVLNGAEGEKVLEYFAVRRDKKRSDADMKFLIGDINKVLMGKQ